MGKGTRAVRRVAESLRRPVRVDDRGGGPQTSSARRAREVVRVRFHIRSPPVQLRRPAHRPRRRRRRDHAQGHRGGLAGRTRREGAPRWDSRHGDRRRVGARARSAAPAGNRGAGAGRTARDGRREHGRGVDDRAGLLRHADASGVAPQHPREPGVVHRVHPVPTGDQPGPVGGTAELPDHGRGSDRPRGGECLDARRGHRRGGGHDADAPRGEELGQPPRGRRRRLRADRGRARHPRRASRHRDRHRRSARRPARRRFLRRDRPVARRQWRRHRLDRPGRARRTSAARWWRSVPTCWR